MLILLLYKDDIVPASPDRFIFLFGGRLHHRQHPTGPTSGLNERYEDLESVYLNRVLGRVIDRVTGGKPTLSRVHLMKPVNRLWLILISSLAAAGASPCRAQTELHEDFVCLHGSVKRVVSVFNLNVDGGSPKAHGCRVDYTKDGETKTLWSSRTDHAYCAAKAAALVTNLVNGNFSCRAETLEQPDDGDSQQESRPPSDRSRDAAPVPK